jgi:homoserine/homoserine lactone efflux protein
MTFATWLLFIAVSILPAISPGPGVLLAISNALRFGPQATLYSALGNTLGLIILGFAVAFGLAALLTVSAMAFTVVKIVGAGYLVYLGFKLWRDGAALSLPSGPAPLLSRGKLFRQALLVSLTNPKALILITALIPPFVDHAHPVLPQVALMSITYGALCFANHLLLAYAGGAMRRFISSERRMRTVRRVLGTMFIGFGAALAAASR